MADLDPKIEIELQAAAFRRLMKHLREREDVQNIDMMNLAGFCRNCLSDWFREAAENQGLEMTKEASREIIYGMPYDVWKANNQTEASEEQLARYGEVRPREGN